jgi:predicted signal transduction protein with EAL and GGDEF domain
MLLKQTAERLTSCIREGDTVARLGGDEFVVVLEDLGESAFDAAAQAETISDKILIALNQPYLLGKNKYQNSVSIGVTLFNDSQSEIEELLRQADIAMYQAKKAGRNKIRFFDPQMQETINTRVTLESQLKLALAENQFQLYYQIQVDYLGHPLGAEALIRWIHPERGMVSPIHFIPLAEETELILPIGEWVLDTACAQLKAWQQDKLTCDLTISINVSAKQFGQSNFVEQVQTTLKRYGIKSKFLKLELTESLLLENIEGTIISMIALESIGVEFSLDDFGTGYSSLQYLKMLPMNQLKIDQSFVRDIVTDSSDRSIVSTIIAMAQSLGFEVIAEGVETEDQQKILLNKGCKRFQGYFFGKPVPIHEFEAALKKV